MKKLLLLIVLSITVLSCDNSPEPNIKVNDQFTFSNSVENSRIIFYNYLDSDDSENAKYFISGNYIYIKGENNLYYRTLNVTNTNYIEFTVGNLLFVVFLCIFTGIFIGVGISDY